MQLLVSHFFGDAISTGTICAAAALSTVANVDATTLVVLSRSFSHFVVVIGFVSNHFQNTLLFEAGDALCFSLCVAMFVVVLGTLCYSFALTSFDRNKQDKLRADDAGFRGGDV